MEILWVFFLKELVSCCHVAGVKGEIHVKSRFSVQTYFCFIKNLLKIQHKRLAKSV